MAEYIEREATLKLLQSIGSRDYRREKGTICDAIKMVMQPHYTPTADVVEVRHGGWVYDPDGCDWGIGAWRCSLCSAKNDNLGISRDINPYLFVGSKYCPHCGAKMDGKGGG